VSAVNRGEVWWVDTPYGNKPYLVVSNRQRNHNLDTVLGARITTSTSPPELDSVVPIEAQGRIVGRVLCDQMTLLPKVRLIRRASNAFTPRQMESICKGIRAAVACP
jgi:mRNA interferase MazF